MTEVIATPKMYDRDPMKWQIPKFQVMTEAKR
jgi:hypothetical protein